MYADRYEICAPSVVSDVIDGEAVIMHLKTGHYFSTRDVACLIWQGIEEKRSLAAIHDRVRAVYDADASTIGPDIDAFLRELLANDLIRAASDAAESEANAAEPGAAETERLAYVAPVLSAYTDMEDLLMLDPIHDVDAVGWPTRKAGIELD
jgi:hypothetical protein